MQLTINNSELFGTVKMPVSKSFGHRILVCASLSNEPTIIYGKSDSDDILATIDCLRKLGATIKETETGYQVLPLWQSLNVNALLDCKESGSTLRFLMPIVSALGAQGRFVGKGNLPNRPMDELIDTLNENGMEINYTMPYETRGQLQPGKFRIKGDISSQFISGLLMGLPLLNDDSYIIIKNELVSIDYINITLDILSKFGIEIETTKSGYYIKGNQKFITPKTIKIEGDWSAAANWVVGGAISKQITLCNLSYPSIQGDSKIVEIIEQTGAKVVINDGNISISKNELRPINIDCENIIDLVPILCILCANIDGESILTNLERLRLKESDRLNAMIALLEAIGINCNYDSKLSALHIIGGNIFGGTTLESYNDHRIVMAGAISAINATNKITILDAECINKSYVEFFEHFIILGGIIDDK